MACFIVTVSITYRPIGSSGSGTTVNRTSNCHASPFSTGLDRDRDGFFLYYNGGDQKLEGNWSGFELVTSSILSQTPCTGCVDPNVYYDCINGACIKKTVYDTPGIYESLSDCQVACGTGCGGKCISNSDWAQIQGLASQLKNRNCS